MGVRGAEVTGLALQRITCNLASAGAEVAIEFGKRYMPNGNPQLLPLAATVAGQPASPMTVQAGHAVDLVAAWPPETVETFPVYDIVTQKLVDHRESMRVSWFASDGKF